MRRTLFALAIILISLSTSGCATAQETLDLSEEVTERGLWYLVATDVTIGAFIEHLKTLPEEAVIPVQFPNGSTASVLLKRDEAIAKLEEIREHIAPIRDGLTRLNTAIQKGRTFVEFLKLLRAGISPASLLQEMLPGLDTVIEPVLPDLLE